MTVLNSPATETVHYENLVKLIAHEAMQTAGITEPVTGPLRLVVEAWFAIPDSRRCTKHNCLPPVDVTEHLAWDKSREGCKKLHIGDFHAQRCDLDNVIKAVSDACNGVVFYDDSQVAALDGTKYWSDTPRAVVTVESLC